MEAVQLNADVAPARRAFARRLARDLRAAGAPAHRVEDRMAEFTASTGDDARFHVLPAAVLVAEPEGTTVLDVSPGAPDLDRLSTLEALAEDVARGRATADEALLQLEALAEAPGRYGLGTTLLAFGVASGSAAVFFGGGPVECGAAAGVGWISGALSVGLADKPHARHLVEVGAAALGVLALSWLARFVPVAGEIALITGLIVLLPGFALTMALTELATRHRVSGTAGLAAGGLVLMELGFGTALGSRLAEVWWGVTAWSAPVQGWPGWVEHLALVGVAWSFAVLLQARTDQVVQVLGACALALHGQRLAADALGPELAGGAAAFAVTVVANHLSQRLRQPAAVWQLPGILLLVPGSIGFRSVTALLEHDTLAGVEGAFGTALAAMALVGGSLLGSALVPPRN